MTANKMPEMPEPEEFIWWMGINENHKARAAKRYYTHDEVKADRRACYLAGIADAKACVPNFQTPMEDERDDLSFGFNRCREATLTNLTALEQEAKK